MWRGKIIYLFEYMSSHYFLRGARGDDRSAAFAGEKEEGAPSQRMSETDERKLVHGPAHWIIFRGAMTVVTLLSSLSFRSSVLNMFWSGGFSRHKTKKKIRASLKRRFVCAIWLRRRRIGPRGCVSKCRPAGLAVFTSLLLVQYLSDVRGGTKRKKG